MLNYSCDVNPLGGSKSKLSDSFEPGKKTSSLPPTISAFGDMTMDQDDTQTINFVISDPDTFMMCSSIYVRAVSSNNTLIDYQRLVIGGAYPNCTLRITPKPGQFGTAKITLEVFDFWSIASISFNLTVLQIFTPGLFTITDAEGSDRAVMLTWSIPSNTTGSSSRFSIFYRPVNTSTYAEVTSARSPFLVPGLTNGQEYDFYVRAFNSQGQRDTTVVQATPTRFRLQGGEFVAGSNQYQNTVPRNYKTFATIGSKSDDVKVTTTPRGYKVYLNSQGNIISGTGP